jgi:hypothetical protein
MTATVSAEGVYKYVKDGKVIYSDQPPPSANAQKMEAYSSSHAVTRPKSAPKVEDKDNQLSAIRTQECNKARARLVEYQNSPTLIQRNLKGEQETLTAEQRIDVIVRAQTDVNDLCNERDETTGNGESNNEAAEVDEEG